MARSNKKTLRDLSREPPSAEEQAAIRDALSAGPPLVTAILGQALIEHHLDNIIRHKLKKSKSENDSLIWGRMTAESGPISTFSQKITLGHALGFYDENLRTNLLIIKNIRNAFAHSKKIISFDDESVVAELRAVRPPPGRGKMADMWSKYFHNLPNQRKYSSLCFQTMIVILETHNRSLAASNRNWNRKNLKPFKLTRPPKVGLGDLGSIGQVFADHLSSDPKAPVRGLNALTALLYPPSEKDKTGK